MGDPAIWIAFAACLISCYFAACTIALRSFSRSKLSERFESARRPERFDWIVQHARELSLMTGIMRTFLSLVILLAILHSVRRYAEQWQPESGQWHWLVEYAVAMGIAGLLVSIFTVAVPVSWARYQPERLLAWSSPLLKVALAMGRPLVGALKFFDPIVRRISGADVQNENNNNGVTEDVLSVVEEHQSSGQVDEAQKEMIEAVFEFPSITAGEIMTPRTDIKGVELDSGLGHVKQRVLDAGFSRFPVYQENLDNIAGMLYAKDLIRLIGSEEPFELRRVLRDAIMVPESKAVRELLAEFKARQVHIAIVLDEYGGTAGLITIEDILEELVGEIQDEYEPPQEEPGIHRIDDNAAEVDARVYIDDLNDEMGLSLPEDEDYDTVGGFVFATLGHIPDEGESFQYKDVKVTVTAAARTKVIKVRVERLVPMPAHPNADRTTNHRANGK